MILQSRLRHEAAYRSTNISIIQTYRKIYSQNQSDRQWAWGVAGLMLSLADHFGSVSTISELA
jgi:hypothetical protein